MKVYKLWEKILLVLAFSLAHGLLTLVWIKIIEKI